MNISNHQSPPLPLISHQWTHQATVTHANNKSNQWSTPTTTRPTTTSQPLHRSQPISFSKPRPKPDPKEKFERERFWFEKTKIHQTVWIFGSVNGILKSVTMTPSIVFYARGSVNGFIIWMWEPSLFDAKGFVNGFIIWMWEPSLFGAIVFGIFFFRNNTYFQTILLVSINFKLFRKLTFWVRKTRFHYSNSSIRDSISIKIYMELKSLRLEIHKRKKCKSLLLVSYSSPNNQFF